MPDNVIPVDNYNLERYRGKVYELARLDHSFERRLTQVTADYCLRVDDGVRVMSRRYSIKNKPGKKLKGRHIL